LSQRSNTLGQILDILKGSTIAEERGKDVSSKFWADIRHVETRTESFGECEPRLKTDAHKV
jgi:hypothetical protein